MEKYDFSSRGFAIAGITRCIDNVYFVNYKHCGSHTEAINISLTTGYYVLESYNALSTRKPSIASKTNSNPEDQLRE